MILVTGPTGSGKTTTLYSALQDLNKVSENISTIEDPIEYNLEGINQCEYNKDINFVFTTALKAFLRQDPDIILVGEIRDLETCEVAVQAALTGHLLLSTIHTNDAPSTVARMLNMGIQPVMLSSALHTVVAQRLLRKICTECKEQVEPPVEQLINLGVSPESANKMKVYKGKGCSNCSETGYRGRIAIYEVMYLTNSMKNLILKGGTTPDIKQAAIENGMKTLRMSALIKVARGETTLEEAVVNTASDL